MMIQEGQQSPPIHLTDETGATVTLDTFAGKKKVVYFYPKDDTPGCTKEACGFRDVYGEIQGKGAVVIGISADSEASHGKFKRKYELPFVLLSDPEKSTIQAFGAWGEKKMYGKTHEGIVRSTFVLDEENEVIKVFPKVKPDAHAAEILELLG